MQQGVVPTHIYLSPTVGMTSDYALCAVGRHTHGYTQDVLSDIRSNPRDYVAASLIPLDFIRIRQVIPLDFIRIRTFIPLDFCKTLIICMLGIKG